jgi:hypothetical protein
MLYLEHVKGRKHLGKTNVDGSEILKGILRVGTNVWTRFG